MSNSIDRASLEAFREDAIEIISEWENTCLRANSIPSEETFRSLLRCAHNLKGNAGLMGFTELRDSIHCLEERLQKLSAEGANPGDMSLLGILIEVEKYYRSWLNEIVESPSFVPDNSNVISRLESWTKDGASSPQQEGQDVQSAMQVVDDGTVRIPSQKLETLIQMVSELTLAQAIVSRSAAENKLGQPSSLEAISACDKLVRALRMNVLDLRMLPIIGLYKKLERASMELSVHLKKPLKFITSGQDVSADKVVLARIFDPLLHLLRNAIDHGLENVDDRKAAGKSVTGTIRISAEIVPGGLQLRISDDGRGLNHKKIRKRAEERGLIDPTDELGDDDVGLMIFEPGFSTADNVTEISGRGVGMDVVKKEVIGLGGQIDFTSRPGLGTEFRITLPANISLIDVLVICCGGQDFCVPIQDIVEAVDVADAVLQPDLTGDTILVLRGEYIPIVSVLEFLPTVEGRVPEGKPTSGFIFLVQFQERVLGIHIEHVADQQQVFVRPLKGYMSTLPRLTGSTILSSGSPSLVINLKEMANDYFNRLKRGHDHGAVPL